MGKGPKHDHEDDESRNPAPILVYMNDLISSKGNEKRADSDDENPSISRNVRIYRMNELSAHDGVGCRPSHASQHVKDGN